MLHQPAPVDWPVPSLGLPHGHHSDPSRSIQWGDDMLSVHRFSLVLTVGCLLAGVTTAQEPPRSPEPPSPESRPRTSDAPSAASKSPTDEATRARVAAFAAEIDQLLEARLTQEQVVAAPLADDAEFLRRAWLDVAGKIPPVTALREFQEETRPDKRERMIEALLEGPASLRHFSRLWRKVLLPETESSLEQRVLVPAFEAWLRQRLLQNVPYDRLVREILELTVDPRQAANPFQPQAELNPLGFYQAKELKPENLAAATARMFLGVRIECAQCHDHPFDDWKQEQFWGYAAFFAGLNRPEGQMLMSDQGDPIFESLGATELAIPLKDKKVLPTWFDGELAKVGSRESPRKILAAWMVSGENPYFARALVNRLWGHFFGQGLVDPIDDFTAENPPSHPELLDLLARRFVEQGYDVRLLIRAITATRAYQRTSRQTDPSQATPRLFSRMQVKGLSPDQIFDSIAQATGLTETGPSPMLPGQEAPARESFLAAFNNSHDSPVETQTTILQALQLMNGDFMARATDPAVSQTLSAIIEFPLQTHADRVETLFLATLGRPPTAPEREKMLKYVEAGGPTGDWREALGDLFWALLNSSEFLFNR